MRHLSPALIPVLLSLSLFEVRIAAADELNLFGEPLPPRVIQLDAGKPVVLFSGGQVKMELVIPEESGTVAAYAAKELQTFLEQALGQPVPLVQAPTGQFIPIWLGDCAAARERGLDVAQIPYDGFTIRIDPDGVVIAGSDEKAADLSVYLHPARDYSPKFARGTWHGVIDFLERFVGVRFYFPGEMGTLVPTLKELTVPCGVVSDRPDKMLRSVPYTVGIWHDRTIPGYDGIVANRLDKKIQYARLKLSSRELPFNHGLAHRGYIERFAEKHPEYFALMQDGSRYCEKHTDPREPRINQFCFSSAITNEIYQDAASYLRGESTTPRSAYYQKVYGSTGKETVQLEKDWFENVDGYSKGWEERYRCFSVMPDDGFFCCQCALCQVSFSQGPIASSTFLWQFTADIGRQLQQAGIPGFVAQLAYGIARPLPELELPSNVLVMVCPIGPWLERLPALRDPADQNIRDWAAKLGHKIQLWNYAINLNIEGAHLEHTEVIPHMTPRAIASYYQRMSAYSDGTFLETYSRYYLYNYLNVYVFAKLHWDTGLDVDALLEEHYQRMFGAAAPVMKQYYEALEDIWLTEISGNVIETSLGPKRVMLGPESVWGEILSPERIQGFDGYFDEAERLTATDAPTLKRVRFIRAELFDRMKDYSQEFIAKKAAILEERLAAKQVMGNMSLLAVQTGGEPLRLDGVGDEAFWQEAPAAWLTPFRHAQTSSPQGTFQVAMDGTNVYFAFRLAEPQMDKVLAPRTTLPENAYLDNCVELFLNPSGDLTRFVQITVASSGIAGVRKGSVDQRTGHMINQPINTQIRSSVRRDEQGWSGELVLPRSELQEMKPDGFPVNFCRNRVLEGRPGEYSSWSRMLEKGFHEIVNWGMLIESGTVAPLVRDGYFTGESRHGGLGAWDFSPKDGEVVQVEDSLFPSALKITATRDGFVSAMQELPTVKPQTQYCLSFQVRTDLGQGTATGFIFDGKNTYWLPGDSRDAELHGISPWTQKFFVFKTHADGERFSVRLGVLGLGKSGSAWFQNVSLIELPNQTHE